MTEPREPDEQERLSDSQAEAVLALAARYRAAQQSGYSQAELMEAGSEVDIPAECMQQAIQEMEKQQRQRLRTQEVRQEQARLLVGLVSGGLIVVAGWCWLASNALLSESAHVEAAWAQVENQLQRRSELLPAMQMLTLQLEQDKHAVARSLQEARQEMQSATTSDQKIAASHDVDQAIRAFQSSLLASRFDGQQEQRRNLQYEIIGTANRLAVERMRYNQAVREYNRKISSFPNSLLANAIGLSKRSYLRHTTSLPQMVQTQASRP